jgi:hypothetical protein
MTDQELKSKYQPATLQSASRSLEQPPVAPVIRSCTMDRMTLVQFDACLLLKSVYLRATK